MPKNTTPEPVEGPGAKALDLSEAALKSNLLSQAATELKNRHVAEYEEIATALFAKAGLKRVRRLTPVERKRKQLEELAAELGVTLTETDDAEA